MNFRRLKNFLTVVETGSIARAARLLHVSQPALSAQMRQLEDLTGCQLLSRSSRGVLPTAIGLEFGKRANEALKLLEGLRGIGQEHASAPTGRVVIGAAVSVANMIAVKLVNVVHALYPGISLEILEPPGAHIGEMLLHGRIDIAIILGNYSSSGMQLVQVLEEDLFVVGLEEAIEQVEFQRLDGVPLVLAARPNSLRMVFDRACIEHGVTPKVVAEVSSPHTMVSLVRAGLGATLLPLSMLDGIRPTDLSVARLINPGLTRVISVATAMDAPKSPQLLAVRQLLLAVLEEQAGSAHWEGVRLLQPGVQPATVDRLVSSRKRHEHEL